MTNFRHFELALAELKKSLVSMGNLVERMLDLGLAAILHPTVETIDQIAVIERQTDDLENAIEERCHELIALQSPLARDLRFLISAMRIASSLEQVGDFTESLAKRASYIARHHAVSNPPQLEKLGRTAVRMVSAAMESFITGNLELAQQVIIDEESADETTKRCYKDIQALMIADVSLVKEYTHLLRSVSYLEHVADIAMSIAEESVYIHRGTIIRHHHDDQPKV
jgi:phosphate transport system protein